MCSSRWVTWSLVCQTQSHLQEGCIHFDRSSNLNCSEKCSKKKRDIFYIFSNAFPRLSRRKSVYMFCQYKHFILPYIRYVMVEQGLESRDPSGLRLSLVEVNWGIFYPASPGWDASRSSQDYHLFIHLGGERHRESAVSCPRTQHFVSGQGSNPNSTIRKWNASASP